MALPALTRHDSGFALSFASESFHKACLEWNRRSVFGYRRISFTHFFQTDPYNRAPCRRDLETPPPWARTFVKAPFHVPELLTPLWPAGYLLLVGPALELGVEPADGLVGLTPDHVT